MIALTDAKNQSTAWAYDIYGRMIGRTNAANVAMVTYAYDANGRATNRWTPAHGGTAYRYDAAGNVIVVDYPTSVDLSLSYDANNRLTNMVDECGTTTFRYASFGGVLSEDGPWGSDTVTYSYDDGRRRREMDLEQFNSAAWVQNYTYDSLGRLTNTI